MRRQRVRQLRYGGDRRSGTGFRYDRGGYRGDARGGATLGIIAGIIGGIGAAFSLIGAAIAAILSGGVLIVTTGVRGEALAWSGEQFTRLRDWVARGFPLRRTGLARHRTPVAPGVTPSATSSPKWAAGYAARPRPYRRQMAGEEAKQNPIKMLLRWPARLPAHCVDLCYHPRMPSSIAELASLLRLAETPSAVGLGFRFGDRGTHTSRTLMLDELETVLSATPSGAGREAYAHAIIHENVTDKRTAATRRLTNQRLGELYALDPAVPLFRVLRRCWATDKAGHPLLALLCALARDPLLRATAPPVLALRPGEELSRQTMTDAVIAAVGDRLNDNIIDKVVRNASSTWTQAGHLLGRVRKVRRPVDPTPLSAAYALLLGYLLGLRGHRLFTTIWAKMLDRSADEIVFLAMDAKRLGFLDLKHAGTVIDIGFGSVLTPDEQRECHGTS